MATFKELLHASFKSSDTEEWLDVHFNRPIGLVFALLWNKLGVHPKKSHLHYDESRWYGFRRGTAPRKT